MRTARVLFKRTHGLGTAAFLRNSCLRSLSVLEVVNAGGRGSPLPSLSAASSSSQSRRGSTKLGVCFSNLAPLRSASLPIRSLSDSHESFPHLRAPSSPTKTAALFPANLRQATYLIYFFAPSSLQMCLNFSSFLSARITTSFLPFSLAHSNSAGKLLFGKEPFSSLARAELLAL